MAEELERLYTVREVANAFHVSEETIRRWIKRGDISYTPVGPFRLKRLSLKDVVKNEEGTNGGGRDQRSVVNRKKKGAV